jgi:hypothetical protein
VTLVTSLDGDVEAVQDGHPTIAMPRRDVKDRQKHIRLLVSLMAGLQCRNTSERNSEYILERYRHRTAGVAWLDGDPYDVLGITLIDKTGKPRRGASLAIGFPSGTPAIVGEPLMYDPDVTAYGSLAVKVSLGATDAILSTRSGRSRRPIIVPALPIRFEGPVVLFGPLTESVAVVHLDNDGNPSSAHIVP